MGKIKARVKHYRAMQASVGWERLLSDGVEHKGQKLDRR